MRVERPRVGAESLGFQSQLCDFTHCLMPGVRILAGDTLVNNTEQMLLAKKNTSAR